MISPREQPVVHLTTAFAFAISNSFMVNFSVRGDALVVLVLTTPSRPRGEKGKSTR